METTFCILSELERQEYQERYEAEKAIMLTINTVNYSHGDFDVLKYIKVSLGSLKKLCAGMYLKYMWGNLPKVEYLHFLYGEYRKRLDGFEDASYTALEIFITNYIVDDIPIPLENEDFDFCLTLEEREELGITEHDCMSCLCGHCALYNHSQYILSQLNDDYNLRIELFEADKKARDAISKGIERRRQEAERAKEKLERQEERAKDKLERQEERAKEKLERQEERAKEKLERMLKEEEEAERKRAKETKRQEKKVYNPPVYPPAQKPKCKGSATMISNAPAQRAWLEKWAKEAWNGQDLWSSKTAVKYVEDRKKGIQTLLCSNVVLHAEITGVEGVLYAEVVEDCL
jgi:hypothetical protein